MSARDKLPAPPAPPAAPAGLSRRRLLGGALAGTLASVLLGRQRAAAPGPSRWTGKTRWIGHC